MNKHFPSLRHLQYLQALARHHSFSRAAEECFVTQSTLSSGIKELEALLGHPVAERSSRNVTLTVFGKDVLSQSLKVLEEAEQLLWMAQAQSKPMSGAMRLGIIPTIAPYWLPEALKKITAHFPDLQLQLREDLTANLLDKLNASDIDAAVIAFPYHFSGLKHQALFRDHFHLAMSKYAPYEQKKALSVSNIDTEHLLVLEDGHCLREHTLAVCKIEPDRKTANRFQMNSLPTLIELVRQGYGHALLPGTVIRSGLANDLRVLDFTDPPFREVGIVWRDHNPLGKDIECLVQMLSA